MPPAAKPTATGVGYSLIICALAVFVVTSFKEGVGLVPLPTFLGTSMFIVPGPFRTHILACCIGIVAGTGALTVALSGRSHRNIGRFALVLLLIGAVTSVPVAWAGSSSPLAKAAFLGQAASLIIAIMAGWRAGCRGKVKLHRDCMASAALALSGAPLSRLALKIPDPWMSPQAGYAAVAWFAWLAPFVLAICVKLARRRGVTLRLGEAIW